MAEPRHRENGLGQAHGTLVIWPDPFEVMNCNRQDCRLTPWAEKPIGTARTPTMNDTNWGWSCQTCGKVYAHLNKLPTCS
jgi:hypothetical protein